MMEQSTSMLPKSSLSILAIKDNSGIPSCLYNHNAQGKPVKK